MDQRFSSYFQDELVYLRELGREFAAAHPALAPMLAEKSGDPDVERLLEGVAFLTARVRQKLDDELPQAIQGIAQLLYPDFVRPVPAAAILELTPLPNVLRERVVVKAGAEFASVEVDGTPCIFRSSVDCELVPWQIEDVKISVLPGGKHELRIEMRVPLSIPLSQIGADRLRLHFAGDTRTSLGLLLWLHRNTESVAVLTQGVAGGEREVALGKGSIRAVGFDEREALLPATATSSPGPRLIEEYYMLPAKFAFVDIEGISRVGELDPKATRFSVAIRFDAPPPADVRLTRETVKLHCVPIVNLFATSAEPISPSPTRREYLVRPAGLAAAQAEVYAITRALALEGASGERFELGSFFDFAHAAGGPDRLFYSTYVRPSVVGEGTDTVVAFGTAKDAGAPPSVDVVSLDVLATNRTLPRALRAGEISSPTASSPALASFRNLAAPTPYVPPPFGRDLQWRVVAHAAMGLSSITDVNVLRAALDVYNFQARVDAQAARANELRLAALLHVRVGSAEHLLRGAPIRGVGIELELADGGFAGAGDMFLFGSVLERFFASYVSINSFSRVRAQGSPSRQQFSWPARSGAQTLT